MPASSRSDRWFCTLADGVHVRAGGGPRSRGAPPQPQQRDDHRVVTPAHRRAAVVVAFDKHEKGPVPSSLRCGALWGDCIRRHADGEAGPMTPDPADTSPRWRRQVPPERRVDHNPCNLVPHGPIASQPHRTQHDQRRGFAVEHRDPPIQEPVPPKVPRWLVTALSPGHAGAIARNDGFEPVGLAWTLRWVWGAMRL